MTLLMTTKSSRRCRSAGARTWGVSCSSSSASSPASSSGPRPQRRQHGLPALPAGPPRPVPAARRGRRGQDEGVLPRLDKDIHQQMGILTSRWLLQLQAVRPLRRGVPRRLPRPTWRCRGPAYPGASNLTPVFYASFKTTDFFSPASLSSSAVPPPRNTSARFPRATRPA